MNDAALAGPDDLRIRINGGDPTFRLWALAVPKSYVRRMTPRTFDLLLIAAAVFVADGQISRGGATRSDFGADWNRELRFVVPVTDVAFWTSAHAALVEALEFVSGDRFEFRFVPRVHRLPPQVDLDLPPPAADQVVLFSGGLDSVTGVFEALASTDEKLQLVSHRSSTTIAKVQINLIRELRSRFPGRFEWVPARGRLVGCEARESTQRSRSFLYASLGYAAASVLGIPRVRFFENGIVSLNLPISRQVIGTMATRTTHPLFLHRLEKLFSLVADEPFAIENPYAWLTKTEVVARLRDIGGADLIGLTTSCSNVRQRTVRHPQCGCCSQCIDRRFATLAADVAEHDPADRYEVDVLQEPRPRAQDRTMANDWTRHAARRLATINQPQFRAAFGADMADVEAAFPNQRPGSVFAEAHQMHRRHGASVKAVLTSAVSAASTRIVEGSVSKGSLLHAWLRSADEPAAPDPMLTADVDGVEADDGTQSIFPLRLEFDAGAGPYLRIRGLDEFFGAHLQIVAGLKPQHDADCAAGIGPDQHRFVPSGKLGAKGNARQHAKRCRDEFARAYEAIEGEPPRSPLLVHSGAANQGYRLDPLARFLTNAREPGESGGDA